MDSSLKENIFDAYNWYCAIPGCYDRADDLHHVMPQSKVNVKKYPLFIHSPFNLLPVCHGCHMNKPLPSVPGERLVQLYEAYLASLS